MRLSFADFSRMGRGSQNTPSSDRDGPGTIYYLKTSTPHLLDVSVSGPYKDLEAVHDQAWHNFGDECQVGQSLLQDFEMDGRAMPFDHIESPINGDPNKKRRIELIRKTKPALAARLPCPVWNVMKAEIATEAFAAGPTGPNRDAMPVEDVDIVDSFESEDAAKQAAEHVVRELAGPGNRTPILQSSPFTAGVVNRQGLRWVVTATRDSGAVQQQ